MKHGAQSELSPLRTVIVHRPGLELELIEKESPNKWLFDAKPNLRLAQKEHDIFTEVLRREGVNVINIEQGTLPNQYFTRDVGFITELGAIVGNFRHEIRKGEEKPILSKLKCMKIPILLRLSSNAYLEGGDVIFIDRREVIIGVGERTNEEGFRRVKTVLLRKGIVEKVYKIHITCPEAFHLDLAFNIASESLVALYPKALPKDFVLFLKSRDYTVIEVPYEDFKNLAINWLAIRPGKVVFIDGYKVNRDTRRYLEAEGIDVISLEISELMKGRGGPRCMTLPVLRED